MNLFPKGDTLEENNRTVVTTPATTPQPTSDLAQLLAFLPAGSLLHRKLRSNSRGIGRLDFLTPELHPERDKKRRAGADATWENELLRDLHKDSN